jgi:hypothetical protein
MFTTIHFTKEYNIELMYKYVQNVIEMFEDTKWARGQMNKTPSEQDTKWARYQMSKIPNEQDTKMSKIPNEQDTKSTI